MHTPRPWKAVEDAILTDEKDPQIIAYCSDHRNRERRPREETLDNAILMSKSPNLLHACRALISYITEREDRVGSLPPNEVAYAEKVIDAVYGKRMIRIIHDPVRAPCSLICECSTGRNLLIQTDWDYPGFATNWGWVPCKKCGWTDGTVDCAHRKAGDMIREAYQFLLDHEGEWVEDPGYFS